MGAVTSKTINRSVRQRYNLKQMKEKNIELDEIINEVNKLLEIDISSRKLDYVVGRGIYYKIAIKHTNKSNSAIAYKVDRDHVAIYNSKKSIEQDMDNRPRYRAIYEEALFNLGLEINYVVEYEEYKTKRDVKISELEEELEKFSSINKDILNIISNFDEETQLEFLEYKLKPHQKLIESRVKPKTFVKVAGAKLLR
jgi:hypothetical protein